MREEVGRRWSFRVLPVVVLGGVVFIGTAELSPVRATAEQSTPAVQSVTPDSTLRALSMLEGRWVPAEDSLLVRRPELRDVVVFEYGWLVGGKAMRLREGVTMDGGDAALEGFIYWDPATERIEWVAVAGRLEGQGRLFRGEFVVRADGRLERNYDVHYRTLADMPGEEFGGSRRRYREVIEPAGRDTLRHTLEWWWQGRWQPYARGRYVIRRLGS